MPDINDFMLDGLKAKLVLEDKVGEFNVAHPFVYDDKKMAFYVDIRRVSDAHARRRELAHDRRPTY